MNIIKEWRFKTHGLCFQEVNSYMGLRVCPFDCQVSYPELPNGCNSGLMKKYVGLTSVRVSNLEEVYL